MKPLIILTISISLVAGCATTEQAATTEGTAGGAALGALLGASMGALFGGSGKAAAIGAGVGALVGGTVGYSYADNVTKRREALRGRENDLDAQIAFARGVNQDTQQYNQRLASEIDSVDTDIDNLLVRINRNEVTQQELDQTRDELDAQVRQANKQLAVGEQQLTELRTFQQTQSSEELDTQIASLENHLQQLRNNTTALASQRQRL